MLHSQNDFAIVVASARVSEHLLACWDVSGYNIYLCVDNKQSIREVQAAHHQLLIMLMMMEVLEVAVAAAADDGDDVVASDRSVPFEVAAFSPATLSATINHCGAFSTAADGDGGCRLLAADCTTFDSS